MTGDDTVTVAYAPATGSTRLQDPAGNQVAAFTVTAANRVDATPPELLMGTLHYSRVDPNSNVSETRARLYFSEPLSEPGPGPEQFQLGVFDVYGEFKPYSVSRVYAAEVAGRTIELKSNGLATQNMVMGVLIRDTAGIEDAAGNVMAAPGAFALRDRNGNELFGRDGVVPLVNALRPDPGKPELAAADPAVVDGDVLTLKFHRVLDQAAPAPGAFTIGGTAAATPVAAVAVRGESVVLRLGRAVSGSETGVTVSYTAPADNPVRNVWGTPADGFTARAVRNARADTTPPALVAGTVDGAAVTLYFSEPLDATAAQDDSQFALSGTRSASGARIAGDTVTLTASPPAAGGDAVSVTISDTTNIRDLAGNQALAVSAFALTNTAGTGPGRPALAAANPAVVQRDSLRLRFDQPLDPGSAPPPGAFRVTSPASGWWTGVLDWIQRPPEWGTRENERVEHIVDSVAVGGWSVVLTLRNPVPGGFAGMTVSYDKAGAPRIRNLFGETAHEFQVVPVTAPGTDTIAPAVVRAAVAGTVLTVVFDEALDAGSAPAGGVFSVRTQALDDSGETISGTGTVAIDGATVTVTLARAVTQDEFVNLEYRGESEANPLRDAAGNRVADFEWPEDVDVPVRDTTAPTLVSGRYAGAGQTQVELYFSEALNPTAPVDESKIVVEGASGNPIAVSSVSIDGIVMTVALGGNTVATSRAQILADSGIRDLAGNEAAAMTGTVELLNTSLTNSDGPPALAAADPAVVDGARLTLNFNQDLLQTQVPPRDAFWFSAAANKSIGWVEVGKSSVVLVLNAPARPCDPGFETGSLPDPLPYPEYADDHLFMVSYAQPAANRIQDLHGAHTLSFQDQAVTNARACVRVMPLLSADGNSMSMAFGRPLDAGARPQAENFALTRAAAGGSTGTAAGEPPAVEGAAFATGDPTRIELALSRAVAPGERLTVSYTRPAAGLGHPHRGRRRGGRLRPPAGGHRGDGGGDRLRPGAGRHLRARRHDPGAGRLRRGGGRRHVRGDAAARDQDGPGLRREVGRVRKRERHRGAGVRVRAGGAAEPLAARDRGARRHAGGERGRDRVAGYRRGRAARPRGARSRPRRTRWTMGWPPDRAPPALSVADARAPEGGTLAFAVRLGAASGRTVTVAYASADGTAAAGEDYAATSGTLAFAPGETEKTVAVAVLADAAAEGEETLTLALSNAQGASIERGAATGIVTDVAPAGPAALTAAFHGLPVEHDGERLFSFELRFSEDFPGRLDYRVLRDAAFRVENGRVREAKRATRGQNRRWTITVRPTSFEDVVVTLPAGAVTTEGGRALSNTVAATVRGPALLSVAGARVEEGAGAALEFAVSLSRAAAAPVTVDYETVDGTAKAGEDYAAASGTLTFAVGETGKTVSVAVLDDAHDEGEETMRLRLSNATGARIVDRVAVGVIENSDPMPRPWLARFGRTVAEQVIDGVDARLAAPRAAGAQATLAGHRLDGIDQDEAQRIAAERLAGEDGSERADTRTMTAGELLAGSAFSMTSAAAEGGPSAALWGRGAWSRFNGREGTLTVDGELASATLGADLAAGRWLAGVMVQHARGAGSYAGAGGTGEVDGTLTGVYPYGRYALHERVSLWAVAGAGIGSLTLTPEGAAAMQMDLSLALAALGLRGTLVEPAAGTGLALALAADGFWVRTFSERAAGMAGAQADATRLRLGLEATWRGLQAGAGAFVPSIEVGVRHDGGAADTGYGVDAGARLSWTHPASGINAMLGARALLHHEAAGLRDWGLSGSLGWDPTPDSALGPSLTLTQTLGARTTGGMDALLGRATLAGLAGAGGAGGGAQRRSLDLRLAYGAGLPPRGVLTPFAEAALSADDSRRFRLGARFEAAAADLTLQLSIERRESAAAAPDHALHLDISSRF